MKAILEFNLPEEKLEHGRAIKSTDAFLALWDIAQEVFRPARKHGYTEVKNYRAGRLNELCQNEAVVEAISHLEDTFYEIVNGYGVNPSEHLE